MPAILVFGLSWTSCDMVWLFVVRIDATSHKSGAIEKVADDITLQLYSTITTL